MAMGHPPTVFPLLRRTGGLKRIKIREGARRKERGDSNCGVRTADCGIKTQLNLFRLEDRRCLLRQGFVG